MNTIIKNSCDFRLETYQKLGMCALLEKSFPNYHGKENQWYKNWLEPVIAIEQIQFFYDEYNYLLGFIAWAFLEKDVQQRIKKTPNATLHFSEWTEGKQPWIIDLVADQKIAKNIYLYACENIFSEHKELGFVRRNNDGSVRRLSSIKNKFYQKKLK